MIATPGWLLYPVPATTKTTGIALIPIDPIPISRGLEHRSFAFAAALMMLLWAHQAAAADLVIVIDDLGYSLAQGERVLALPVPVTLALLPFAPASAELAERARQTRHEIILHQPMEPLSTTPETLPPGTLTLDMTPERFSAQVEAAFAALPGIVGVNNHTGSRLTQDEDAMRRLMEHVAAHGLLFLDSRTTPATVAYAAAREAHVPALKRDVFLDHRPERHAIEAQFQRALAIAARQGHAVIIAHPHPVTLTFLAETLGRLPRDVSVIPLRELAERARPGALARHESPASPRRSLGQ